MRSQANKSNFNALFFEDSVFFKPLQNGPVLVFEVAQKPGAVGLSDQLAHPFDSEVQVVVAQTSDLDVALVEGEDHLLAFVDLAQQGRRKDISGEQN